MAQILFDKDGNEIEAVPVDEVKDIQESVSAKDARIAELEAEIQKGGSARTERTEELKQLREAREADARKVAELETSIRTDKENQIKGFKQANIEKYAGANEELRAQLEAEYALYGIPEDSRENIDKRFEKAARVLGLFKEEADYNPAFNAFSGREPFIKGPKGTNNDGTGFLKTEAGSRVASYLGLPDEK